MTTSEILQDHEHLPWPLPTGRWQYYQEWNEVLFFHWPVAPETIQAMLPQGLEVDTWEGQAYVSLVPFKLERIRPRGLPAVSWVSDFPEVNVRTYVLRNGNPGVYFLSIEAGKPFASWLARSLSGLPYTPAQIQHGPTAITAEQPKVGNRLRVEYEVGGPVQAEPIDLWLTERYAVQQVAKGSLKTFPVLHAPWTLRQLEVHEFEVDYPQLNSLMAGPPARVGYSNGVQVLAWNPH